MNTRRKAFGFSLIEILVVVVIVAIVTSIALLSVGIVGDDRELRTEARRLLSLVELAQDEALLQGRELGLEVMTHAYRFVEYDPVGNRWNELPGDEVLRLRELSEDIELVLFLEDKRVLLAPGPESLTIEGNEDEAYAQPTANYAPHVLIFSSGDMTPFELHLVRDANEQLVVVANDATDGLGILDEQV